MLLVSLLVFKNYFPMLPMVKKLRYFYGKKKSVSYLACLDRLISMVLKSSAYLHFWSLMKSETKIAVFGSITRYLLA